MGGWVGGNDGADGRGGHQGSTQQRCSAAQRRAAESRRVVLCSATLSQSQWKDKKGACRRSRVVEGGAGVATTRPPYWPPQQQHSRQDSAHRLGRASESPHTCSLSSCFSCADLTM